MKTLRKLEINPARLMSDEELITLKGGEGDTGFKCLMDEEYLGCINIPSCRREDGLFACITYNHPQTNNVDFDCGVTLSGCYPGY